jgi:hypothetical protein
MRLKCYTSNGNWDSVAGTATVYVLHGGSIQPPTKLVPGTLSPGIKQEEREPHNSPAEDKKMWIYTSISHKLSWSTA